MTTSDESRWKVRTGTQRCTSRLNGQFERVDRNERVRPADSQKKSAWKVEGWGRSDAHLGPIKKTLQAGPLHALMHDARSPVHDNEYCLILKGFGCLKQKRIHRNQ